jgi:hypothetical protein
VTVLDGRELDRDTVPLLSKKELTMTVLDGRHFHCFW